MRSKILFLSLFLAISFISLNSQQARAFNFSLQNDKSLELGKSLDVKLKADESQRYQISLVAGQFLEVVVEQKNIDVALVLLNPDNKELTEVDSPNGTNGVESLCWLAEKDGVYILQVRSVDKDASSGAYNLKIKELRASTEQDKNLITAQQNFAEGQKLYQTTTVESLKQATEKYLQAFNGWQMAGEQVKAAYALDSLGRTYDDLGQKQKSLDTYKQALLLEKASNDKQMEAITLNNIGLLYRSGNQTSEAINYYNQALEGSRVVKDKQLELATLNNLASVYSSMGDKDKALASYKEMQIILHSLGDSQNEAELLSTIAEIYKASNQEQQMLDCYSQALQLFKANGNYKGESSVFNNLGLFYRSIGEQKKALDSHNQALTIAKAKNDSQIEAATLTSIGAIYESTGKKQEALDIYSQALLLSQKAKELQLQATVLNNLGLLYRSLGEKKSAIDYYNQALAITRTAKNKQLEATTLHNLAKAYDLAEERKLSLEYLTQALVIEKALGERNGQIYSLSAIGVIYDALGETQKAIDSHNQALDIAHTIKDRRGEALSLNNLAIVYQTKGEIQKATEYYNQALPLWQAMSDRSGESVTLFNLAVLERDQDKPKEALERIKKAIEIIELTRTNLKNQELRVSYFASVQDFYEVYIDILIRLHEANPKAGYDGEALKISEQARARSLLELLAEAQADIRQGVDSELVERERRLQQVVNFKEQDRLRILERKHTREEEDTSTKDLDIALGHYQKIQAEIRQKSPRYAALTQPQALSASEIQSQLLDENTVLLEYFLGREKSYLWAVTKNSLSSFTLAKQSEIDEVAQKLYLLFTERNQAIKEFRLGHITEQERDEHIAKAEKEYPKTATKLSQMILTPVAKLLGKKRLLIVADGALQYIPFTTLTSEFTNQDTYSPLILSNEIVVLPSATTLALERKFLASRKMPSRSLAVVADPIFDNNDERIKNISIKIVEKPKTDFGEQRILDRISEDEDPNSKTVAAKHLRVPRLPFTDEEAKRIFQLVKDETALKVTGFQANRIVATSGELSAYKYIHIATHGYFDAERPELSAIIFSMLNEKGEPEDGFLRTHEVFNLSLPSEMVVLSACETGLGKEIKGEGLVGLTRGFMYAGASRVVVSLWSVNDKATAELMSRFYKKIFSENQPPSTALRLAQIEMIEQTEFKSPFYWAPFIIQGECR